MENNIHIGITMFDRNIKQILKLPNQDFYTELHESGEEYRIRKRK